MGLLIVDLLPGLDQHRSALFEFRTRILPLFNEALGIYLLHEKPLKLLLFARAGPTDWLFDCMCARREQLAPKSPF